MYCHVRIKPILKWRQSVRKVIKILEESILEIVLRSIRPSFKICFHFTNVLKRIAVLVAYIATDIADIISLVISEIRHKLITSTWLMNRSNMTEIDERSWMINIEDKRMGTCNEERNISL